MQDSYWSEMDNSGITYTNPGQVSDQFHVNEHVEINKNMSTRCKALDKWKKKKNKLVMNQAIKVSFFFKWFGHFT